MASLCKVSPMDSYLFFSCFVLMNIGIQLGRYYKGIMHREGERYISISRYLYPVATKLQGGFGPITCKFSWVNSSQSAYFIHASSWTLHLFIKFYFLVKHLFIKFLGIIVLINFFTLRHEVPRITSKIKGFGDILLYSVSSSSSFWGLTWLFQISFKK